MSVKTLNESTFMTVNLRVGNREIYLTQAGTWSSRSQLLGSAVAQAAPVRALNSTRLDW